MRRHRSERRLFRGSERSRLATMVLLMLMLFVLIPLVRQRTDWFAFFVAPAEEGDPPDRAQDDRRPAAGGEEKSTTPKTASAKTAAAKTSAADTSAAPAARSPVEAPSSESPESASPGSSTDDSPRPKSLAELPPEPPLSDDELERQRLKELLSVVVDGREIMAAREMPAYFHLLKKVRDESPESLKKRARFNPKFNDFYQYASKHRGEVVQVELNIRRIDRILWEEENVADLKEVYELWGWTKEAKAWLYVGITPELPEGMKVGEVEERATLVGYFFKLQGYQAGDAKAGARPLLAPAIIGRIVWKPQAPPPQEPWWMWAVVGGVIVVVLGFLAVRILGSRRPRPLGKLSTDAPASAPDWLRPAPTPDEPREQT